MESELQGSCRYFSTYSGIKLPIKLTQPLDESAIVNRNTYFRAYFDAEGRMTCFQKMVYGEVELQHRYEFHPNGTLKLAEITSNEEEEASTIMQFDENSLAT